MNHRKIILSLILVGCTVMLYPQQKDSAKVFIYEPFKSGQSLDVKKNIKVNQNCFKWNWSLLGRGVFAINYERLITSNFSFELGGGLTYRDYMYEAGRGDELFGTGSRSDAKTDKIKLGPYLEGNVRFYPSEGDLDGFYLSPFVRYRSYNIENMLDNKYYNAGYNMTDIGLNIGIQREVYSSGVLVDSYFGVAYRNRIATMPYSITDYNNTITTVTTVNTNTWVPTLTLGFKIGFPF